MTTNVSIDKLLVLIQVKMDPSVSSNMKKMKNEMTAAEKKADALRKSMQLLEKGLMGVGLSTLFTGMAIKRLGTTILTSLVTAFVSARDEGDFFVNKLLSMQAAFEFLKFAIFDAFANSEMFLPLIDGIISLTNRISTLVTKNPKLATMIVIFSLMAIVVGAVMMIVGQLALSLLAIPGAISFIKGSILALKTLGVAGIGSIIAATLAWTAIIGGVALIIGFLIFFWDEFKTATIIRFKQLKLFLSHWWESVKLLVSMGVDAWKLGFANMKLFAVDSLNDVLTKTIDIINKMIRAFNLLNPFSKISEISFSGISTKGISSDINEITKSLDDKLAKAGELDAMYRINKRSLKAELLINQANTDQKLEDLKAKFGIGTDATDYAVDEDEQTQTQQGTAVQVNQTFNGPTNSQDVKDMLEEYFKTVTIESIGAPNGG